MPVETCSGIMAGGAGGDGGDTTANEIAEYLDKKFEEFKDKLVEEIRKEIINEVRSKLEVQDEKIMILESNVEMLQNHVSYLKETQEKSAMEDVCVLELKTCNVNLTKHQMSFWIL